MTRSSFTLVLVPILALVVGCATPQSQFGGVSRDDVLLEQGRQQQYLLEKFQKQEGRLYAVAFPLLRAAVPLCANNTAVRAGFQVFNASVMKGDFHRAALALGYNDTLVVTNVVPDFAADIAGLKAGDRILSVNGTPIQVGERAFDSYAVAMQGAAERGAISFRVRREGEVADLSVTPDVVCAYSPSLTLDDVVNAWADGQNITVTSGMMRFAADDDELATVVAHEIAHDAMNHIGAKKKNALLGGLLGAAADVLSAAGGVNTQGAYTKQGMDAGAGAFSQDFEREADYVGLYILAMAERPYDAAANFWRQMASRNPASIKFGSTHPTSAERFVRLEKASAEIDGKRVSHQRIFPEMKKKKD